MSFAVAGSIMVGATVVQTGLQYMGAKKAGKAARRQAKEEARIEGLKTKELIRDLNVQERVMYGETLAQYAGSGVRVSHPSLQKRKLLGSPQVNLQEQAREFAAERKIIQEVGASNITQIRMEGSAMSDYYKYQGYSSIIGGIGDIAGGVAGMYGKGAFG